MSGLQITFSVLGYLFVGLLTAIGLKVHEEVNNKHIDEPLYAILFLLWPLAIAIGAIFVTLFALYYLVHDVMIVKLSQKIIKMIQAHREKKRAAKKFHEEEMHIVNDLNDDRNRGRRNY